MKTPKEKAEELFDRYHSVDGRNPTSKIYALFCVMEIIEQWEYIDTYIADLGGKLNPNLRYWQEVANELKKL